MPAVYRPRMHFYNTPITPDFADASHPLNIIRGIYRPGGNPTPHKILGGTTPWCMRLHAACRLAWTRVVFLAHSAVLCYVAHAAALSSSPLVSESR